jgi:AcrR family transcriptional regulator
VKIPRRSSPKGSTHDRVLASAKALFTANGFENTSTASIARAAQTSESQIIKHFGSKDGLLEAIFEDGWRHITESFAAIEHLLSPKDELQALGGLILAKLGEDHQLKQLFLLEGRRIRKEGHMILMTRGFLDLVRRIDALLAAMRNRGELLPELNLQGMRSALVGMMEGLLRDQMLAVRANYPASFDSEDIRRLFLHMLRSFCMSPLQTTGSAQSER